MTLRIIQTHLIALGLLAGVATAQTYEQVAPQTLPVKDRPAVDLPAPAAPEIQGDQNQVLAAALRGLIFVSSQAAIVPGGRTDSGVVVDSLSVLDSDNFRSQFQNYIGQPLTLGLVRTITREVILYLRTHDRPVVDVIVPEQNIAGGVLQMLVIEGRIGEIRVEGNRWFSAERLRGTIRQNPGDVIAGQRMLADVGWLNQNPFRQVDLVFARGANTGETDVILRTNDRRPWRVFTGYEDSGNALTDDSRVIAGVNLGNVFNRDQQLNYQLMASPDFEQLVAHSLSYVVPLPWRHTLTVFGSYANSRPDLPGGLFSLDGTSWQMSARYRIPLGEWRGISQDFTVGADFKRSNNDLAFGGAQVFAQSTDVVQFNFGYSAAKHGKGGATSLDLTAFFSPGGITARNSTSSFTATRAGAKADYSYARLTLERTTKLPQGFSWLARATGQFGTANLLGSEQLGMGGYTALRGYEEREINGDGGIILINELQTPGHRLGAASSWAGELKGLAFFDAGVATIHDPLPGEDDRIDAASVGMGLRYRIGSTFTLRADYGWQLKDGVSGRSDSRAHLGATLAY